MTDAMLILVAGALLAAGWAASLLAERFRVPALVLFLGVGMAIGSDGTGWIDFSDYEPHCVQGLGKGGGMTADNRDLTDYGRECRVCGLPVYHCPAANGSPEDCNPPLRKCCECGSLDAPHDWQVVPGDKTIPMCAPYFEEADAEMQRLLGRLHT